MAIYEADGSRQKGQVTWSNDSFEISPLPFLSFTMDEPLHFIVQKWPLKDGDTFVVEKREYSKEK